MLNCKLDFNVLRLLFSVSLVRSLSTSTLTYCEYLLFNTFSLFYAAFTVNSVYYFQFFLQLLFCLLLHCAPNTSLYFPFGLFYGFASCFLVPFSQFGSFVHWALYLYFVALQRVFSFSLVLSRQLLTPNVPCTLSSRSQPVLRRCGNDGKCRVAV